MSSQDFTAKVTVKLNGIIDLHKRRHIVLSSSNVDDLCDRELERYERVYGEVISEAEFTAFCNMVVEDLLEQGKIYVSGDLRSYLANVRAHNCIAQSEAWMENELTQSRCRVVFRDVEFPYDELTGRFMI